MGTKDATGKVLKPLSGAKKCLENHPEVLQGRTAAVEVAGMLHRGCKRGAREVCLHGVSKEAVLYITQRLNALMGEGAKLVVVFDGDRTYEAKQACQEKT